MKMLTILAEVIRGYGSTVIYTSVVYNGTLGEVVSKKTIYI